MQGRKPRPLSIDPADLPRLQQIARSDSLPWFLVRRARIVLANACGVPSSTIAFQVQCDESTIWRTCRRYETDGLTGFLAPPCRSGRPERISPPPASPDCRLGLPGAGGPGTAHHPLVQ
jgi:hypothetical protein